MHKKVLFSFILLFSFIASQGQQNPISESKYVDIITKNNLVYALSKTNKLVVWDVEKGDIKYIKKEVSCIHLDKNNTIFCATVNGEILKEDKLNAWKKSGAFTGKPYAIFSTSNNQIVSLSSRGIKFNNVYHMPSEKHRIGNGIYSFKNNKLRKPQLTYIDHKNRIWISYDFGKFSEVFIFDTKKGSFVNNKVLFIKDDKKTYNSREEYLNEYQKQQLKKYPYYVKKDGGKYSFKFPTELPLYYGLKSICQDNSGNYYFSEGLAHSHKNSGLFTYNKTSNTNFYTYQEHYERLFKKRNEIFGPLAFNKHDKSLYFYSNHGIYKLIKKDKKINRELIVDPNILLYTESITHQYGNLMNVKKIVFIDQNRFAFLTSQYGFGYFDGENINLFN